MRPRERETGEFGISRTKKPELIKTFLYCSSSKYTFESRSLSTINRFHQMNVTHCLDDDDNNIPIGTIILTANSLVRLRSYMSALSHTNSRGEISCAAQWISCGNQSADALSVLDSTAGTRTLFTCKQTRNNHKTFCHIHLFSNYAHLMPLPIKDKNGALSTGH